MGYSIKLKKSVEKEIKKLPQEIIRRVIKVLEELESNAYPRGTKKIKGSERTYRLRVGDYRIIYQVDEEKKEIVIYHIRKREEAYERI